MNNLFRHACLALVLFCGAGFITATHADVKIKAKNTSGGQVSEQTTYIKGKRQRTELSENTVTITQCDLRRSLQLGVPTKTYVVTPFDQKADGDAAATAATGQKTPASATPARRGGLITSTFTATDTGERKKMFGYTARRIKTGIVTESSPDACQVSRSRMETDGWYIDAAFVLDCDYRNASAYNNAASDGGCRDEFRAKYLGVTKLGYPVSVKTTLFDEQGNESFTFTQEVLEITNAVLDSALFDAPADYRQVSDMRELYGMPAMASAARDDDNDDNSSGSGGAAKSSATGAKRAGVVRVGVALTKTIAAADYVDASALADAVRNVLVSNLNGSAVEVVALEARQTEGVESEARQKECDYVLYSTVSHKKGGGGGFGGFLKKSAEIAAGSVVASSASGGRGGAAGSLKARDELTLEYKLQRGTDAVVANTLKAKAKSDGDDIISQLAGQAATAVRAAATSK
ncbi:MAG TPA: hypothetical protein VIQ24_08885 [Pyrinomonadaceae bacterium]